MKVPPKRKGNAGSFSPASRTIDGLNESPSEKEGKSQPEVQALGDGGPQ